MIIFFDLLFLIVGFALIMSYGIDYNDFLKILGFIAFVICLIIFVFGCFHGFIYYPKTEGMHQGVITAVDLEGKYFRRYEVYLKSSGYTEQSDETKYLIYETEESLAKQLKEYVGKKVKLYYGHDGGYINWKSCGTYHIKNVELVEE